jgi:hypothetical protein
MPRTPWIANDDLAIEVTDFKARYAPGDVIQGQVVRRSHSEFIATSVRLVFFGRTKTSFVSYHCSASGDVYA